jgi:hypothetical protein
MMRYQLTIGRPSEPGDTRLLEPPGKFHHIKSAIAAFLALAATIGVLLAAFVLGSVLAIVILILAIVVVSAWFFLKLWHRVAG